MGTRDSEVSGLGVLWCNVFRRQVLLQGGGTFGVCLPVCIVRSCRVVCPVPEVLPAGAEAGEGHVGSEF